jgi:hypothetical protein
MKGVINMASLDEIFYKEFNQMMYQLKGNYGYMDLADIPLPPEAQGKFFVESRNKIFLGNIVEEYYSKLAGTETLYWGTSALKRRQFDYKGEFMKDKNGKYILKDVTCPNNCMAVISDLSIGVPNKFKSKEGFQYVDMITKTFDDGKKLHKFVYIIPKKYCYKMEQTALVFSWNKLRSYYSGIAISMQNGHILYVYIVPYRPTSQSHNYRIIHTKTSTDYTEELQMIKDYWIKIKFMFNPDDCQLYDYVRGRENMAIQQLDGVIDNYERFDITKSMGDVDTFEDVDFAEE